MARGRRPRQVMSPEQPYIILGRLVLEWIQGEPVERVLARQVAREKLYTGVDTRPDDAPENQRTTGTEHLPAKQEVSE